MALARSRMGRHAQLSDSDRGRVVLFSNAPIYRWRNHGEFNMVFNALLNWNDLAGAAPSTAPTTNGGDCRPDPCPGRN